MTEKKKHVRVTFQPEGRAVYCLEGTPVLEAAVRAGIVLDTPCGGQGTCGKCRVVISAGAPAPSAAERKHFSDEELQGGARLACQARVGGEMTVEIPVGARFFEQKILTDGTGKQVPLNPTVTKHHITPPQPSLEDQRADADRVLAALDVKLEPCLEVLNELPGFLRRSGFDITAVVAEDRVLAVEAGDTSAESYGIAFDIGTTTVVGFLTDLHVGRECAVASRTNAQVAFGDDVVSRISHAATPAGRKELQEKIIGCLNEIIAECCEKAGVSCDHIYEATVVGNTTMNHLFLGVDPQYVAQAPYVAAVRRPVNVRGWRMGLKIHPRGIVHTLPNIAGFVGADTVGVILASGMHEAEEPLVAIDIGTNGELVAGNRDRLIACSTAAGPAFEGARITYGMRAADGAIDKVIINEDVEYNVIGNAPPRGICGTALIDLVAELLRVGAVDETGRLLPPGELPSRTPRAVAQRIVEGDMGSRFVVVPEGESGIDGPIFLTQRDIREMQLAKGAIAAGLNILLREAGVEPKDLSRVLLAGAFGNFIRRKMAKGIGLLPDVPSERIRYIGNAAGAGARMALLSKKCKEEADDISERVEYLELAGRPDFQAEFASAMFFPAR